MPEGHVEVPSNCCGALRISLPAKVGGGGSSRDFVWKFTPPSTLGSASMMPNLVSGPKDCTKLPVGPEISEARSRRAASGRPTPWRRGRRTCAPCATCSATPHKSVAPCSTISIGGSWGHPSGSQPQECVGGRYGARGLREAERIRPGFGGGGVGRGVRRQRLSALGIVSSSSQICRSWSKLR